MNICERWKIAGNTLKWNSCSCTTVHTAHIMHIECGDEQNCDMAVSANAVAESMESNAKLCHAVTMTTVTADDDANDNIRNMLNNLTGQIYSAIDCIAFHKHVYCSFRYKHKANLMPFNFFSAHPFLLMFSSFVCRRFLCCLLRSMNLFAICHSQIALTKALKSACSCSCSSNHVANVIV